MPRKSVTDRPILFSAEMVRALLNGCKSQTRRPLNPQPHPATEAIRDIPCDNKWWPAYETTNEHGVEYRPVQSDYFHSWSCPFGVVGDRLRVKEIWETVGFSESQVGIIYTATPNDPVRWINVSEDESRKWADRSPKKYSSIHMPRWASRIYLRITDIRVERIKDITDDDAIREGTCEINSPHRPAWDFAYYWQSIYKNWHDNPWVWVIDFDRLETKGGNLESTGQ